MLTKFQRIDLGHFPTRIEYLKNISEELNGPQIFIKRDDCTGLATGGNKTRKLEFILPDVIKNNADLVVTVGAIQSNHARQTAAACAKLGIKCLIVLEQRLAEAPEAYMNSGNIFLNKVFGAEMILCPKERDVKEYAEEIMEERKSMGFNPYFIPVGGSNHLGELGYIECMREIIENPNKDSFTHIVLATGSGGTHAGLVAGKTLYQSDAKIIGISIKDTKSKQENKVFQLAQHCCEYVGCKTPTREDVVVDGYVGSGYAIPADGMRDALSLMATKEAILLDPVYTGKAFDGLVDLVRKNHFNSSDRVLFLHTGGSAALPAFEWAFS
ncbi:D-cysteine desulfhydrase family protein [Candidatus Thioglobus sp.]|nr:D-cysteine desulfhydrase family protein [Candidatus Thioglobus sp.]